MAKINLLPWREERRQQLNKVFMLSIFFIVLVVGGLILLVDAGLYGVRSFYQIRVDRLNSEILKVEKYIKEIDALKEARTTLIQRINVVGSLQRDREMATRIFEGLTLIVPSEVYFTSFKVVNGDISINAVATSHNRIAEIMNNIKNTDYFVAPNITTITKNRDNKDIERSVFDITMKYYNEKQLRTEVDAR